MVDVGVADEEIESYSRTARGEDVVGGRDHLDTVDEPLEHVALNSRLHHVPVLNTVLRADELLQRGEVPYLPVPTHDFRISLVRLETPEEHLVPGAEMWRDRAAQPYLDLLEVLGRRILAENGALPVLVLPPVNGTPSTEIYTLSLHDARSAQRLR